MATAELNPVPCDICLNANAKFYCNTCGDALCPTCKTYHLRSKGSKHHDVVPYAQKLNPKYLASLSCHEHPNNTPEFWCEKCLVPICASCIIGKHKGHECCSITGMLSEKRDKMVEEMKFLRDKMVGEWEDVLKQAQTITAGYIGDIDKIEKDLLARAKDMHNQVEAILSRSQQTLKEMKADGLEKLQKQEEYLADQLKQLREDAQRSEDRLRDADPNVLLQFKPSTTQSNENATPSLKTVSPPNFIAGQNDDKALEEMFGQISENHTSESSSSLAEEISGNTKLTKRSESEKATVSAPPPSSGQDITKRSLIPNPPIHSQFKVAYDSSRIACMEQGLAWVETRRNTLQLVDNKGSVKDTMKMDFNFSDFALSSDGDILLADKSNKCILSVSKQKRFNTLFKTSWAPTGLCCLHSNDIVVTLGYESKVIVYKPNGNTRKAFDHIKFRYPDKVAVNKVNQDIYICDRVASYTFAGKLLAVGADWQLRYEYTGQVDKVLGPAAVCTDQMGHVLIADYGVRRVHILDQEGQFIQYVLTAQQGLQWPTTIDVDTEGYVWVGDDAKQIMVAKYLQ